MKTSTYILLLLSGVSLAFTSCNDQKAEEAKRAAAEKKALQISHLKEMDKKAKQAREAASKGTVPEPKPVGNPFLK